MVVYNGREFAIQGGVMMSRVSCWWMLFFCVSASWAGNRADVNADGQVNALDLAVLSNLLAGNLALSNYDLAHVVVVSENGGDFTNPADAADWVAAQAFDYSAIVVTPGLYEVDRPIRLGSNSSLIGYANTSLIGRTINAHIGTPSDATVVQILGTNSAVVNCQILLDVNPDGDDSYSGIYVSSDNAFIRNSKIEVRTVPGNTSAVFVEPNKKVLIEDSNLDCANISVLNQKPSCVDTAGPTIIRRSILKVQTFVVSQPSYAIYLRPGSDVKVYNSQIEAVSVTDGMNYYLFRYAGAHDYAFFHSTMQGYRSGDANGIIFSCCNFDGVEIIL